MGNEILNAYEAARQLQASQEVKKYLREIDASKLVVYIGLNIEPLAQAITECVKGLETKRSHFFM
jgi:hypothetical protein